MPERLEDEPDRVLRGDKLVRLLNKVVSGQKLRTRKVVVKAIPDRLA